MANTMQTTRPDQSTTGTVDTAKERASDVASTAGAEARGVAQDAKTHAREVMGEARHQLRSQAGQQTERVSGSLRQISEQLRGINEGRGAPSGMVADLTHQLAGVTENVATRLESGGIDGALDDVKRFARNRPGMFLAIAAGAGFMVGRLMKAVDTKSVVDSAKEAMSSEGSGSTQSNPNELGAASVGAVGTGGGAPSATGFPGIGA